METELTTTNHEDTADVLNLPLRKSFALEILRGEKVREYRTFNDHWAKRLCTFDDPTDKYLATGLKPFNTVHFYPYNNKWHLDCEIKAIDLCKVDEEFNKYFGEEVEAEPNTDIIVITLGKIIDTNLTM